MEKTYTFINVSLINPDDIENSKIVTIELTANQVVTHMSRNTELWRKYVPIEDVAFKIKNLVDKKEQINDEILEHEIQLDLSGEFDPFLAIEKPIEKPIEQLKPKGKRGRKPKK